MSVEEEKDFSLIERMKLNLNKFWWLNRYAQLVIIVCILAATFLVFIDFKIIGELEQYGTYEWVDEGCSVPSEGNSCFVFTPFSPDYKVTEESMSHVYTRVQEVLVTSLGIIGVTGAIVIYYVVRGRPVTKELQKVSNEFVRKSYLLNFDTMVPRGKDRNEKIFSLAVKVFPEIKEAVKKARKKGKKPFVEGKKTKKYQFDIEAKTSEGRLIVKFFDEEVKFDDVKELVKKVENVWSGKKDVFRVLCVGKQYEKMFDTKELDDEMDDLDRKFPLDIIIEEENGFSMIWID